MSTKNWIQTVGLGSKKIIKSQVFKGSNGCP